MEQYAMHVDSRNRGMELVTSWVLVSDYTGLKLCCFKKPSDKKKNTNERGSVRRDTVPYLDREHLLPR